MPNSFAHLSGSYDNVGTCIAPINPPYGRWNTDEIFWASLPAIILMTLWRLFFVVFIGKYLGQYIANIDFPDPSPKPLYLSLEKDFTKLSKLETFYIKRTEKKNKIPKRKKQQKPKNSKDVHIINKIKRRKTKNSKKLILPKGIPTPQSKENLAFLASLDSDETRSEIPILCKDLGYNLTQIREYWQWKRDDDASIALQKKFNEEAWKGITMLFVTIYGIYCMSESDFFSNPYLLWTQWPQMETPAVYIYYQISIGYHAHRALWQFYERKRSDFAAMFIHHWVTVTLIYGSWYWGLMNIGALVMVCHDNADIFLPFSKLGRWAHIDILTNISFACFVSSWVGSRIILFSFKVIFPVYWARSAFSCHFWKWVFFTSLLTVLLILHIYWFRLIGKVAIDALCFNKQVEDTRSTDEEDNEIIIDPEEFASDSPEMQPININNTNDSLNETVSYKLE